MKAKVLLALAGIALLGFGATPAYADTLVVDKDELQCPTVDFNSIEAAVQAAAPGDTIRVCPDVYNEEVTIDKPLTIKGTGHGGNANGLCFTAPTAPDPTRDSILDGEEALEVGFIVESPGVVIDGFVIENYNTSGIGVAEEIFEDSVAADLAAGGLVGLSQLTPSALSFTRAKLATSKKLTDVRISDNVVQNNLIGAFLQSVGENATVVTHNCFRSNALVQPELAERQAAGVLSFGDLVNASIDNNGFLRHSVVGVGLLDVLGAVGDPFETAPKNVTIAHNQSLEDFVSYGFQGSKGITMVYNRSIGNTFSAIFIANGNTRSRIDHNLLVDGARGIYFDAVFPFAGPPSTDLDVHYNEIRNMVGSEIPTGEEDPDEDDPDTIVYPGSGISIEVAVDGSLQNSRLTNNISTDNTQDGIRVEGCMFFDTPPCLSGNLDNLIANNILRRNDQHDCHDDTLGPFPPAGTANEWVDNQGDIQNRPGLCRKAETTGPSLP
jgi:hypothetical protein